MDLRKIKKLIDLLEESNLAELEIKEGEETVRLSRIPKGVVTALPAVAPAPQMRVEPHATAPAAAASNAAPAASGESALPAGHVVTAPMVGTFYASSNPESPPFVKVGDSVSEGQVLCIIEAMKLMNEIEADVSGVIAKMFVPNGSPVEYGMPLFGIKTS